MAPKKSGHPVPPERARHLADVTADVTAAAKAAQKTKPGRKTVYTEAAAMEILRRVASGETLRQVCRDAHLPAESTVREWRLDDREGFAARFTRAREMQLEAWADDQIEIADDGTRDFVERENKSGEGTHQAFDGEHVQRSRLKIETRRWLMSKLRPDLYGERLAVDGNMRVSHANLLDRLAAAEAEGKV
jgi:Bacteriophage Sf6, terminase small subunit-like